MQTLKEGAMADNYLEKKYEDLQARKAREQRLRQAAWKKRMDAYRKRLLEQETDNLSPKSPEIQKI